MTANELIRLLQERGAALRAERGQLIVDAPAGTLTDEIVHRLRGHKAAAIDWLRTNSGLPPCTTDWPPCWLESYEERAAIIEHDGGFSRLHAERRAEELVRQSYRRRG